MEKVEDFLKRKKWMQNFMADRVVSTLGDKGVSQGLVSNWATKGFVVTSEGWIINPKHNCRLIERHWPCNEGVGNAGDKKVASGSQPGVLMVLE